MRSVLRFLMYLLITVLTASCELSGDYESPICGLEGEQNRFICLVKNDQKRIAAADEVRVRYLSHERPSENIPAMLHALLLNDRLDDKITALGGFDEEAVGILEESLLFMERGHLRLDGCRVYLYLPSELGADLLVRRFESLGAAASMKRTTI